MACLHSGKLRFSPLFVGILFPFPIPGGYDDEIARDTGV